MGASLNGSGFGGRLAVAVVASAVTGFLASSIGAYAMLKVHEARIESIEAGANRAERRIDERLVRLEQRIAELTVAVYERQSALERGGADRKAGG